MDKEQLSQKITRMTANQARIGLLAVLNGKPIENAVLIALSYGRDDEEEKDKL